MKNIANDRENIEQSRRIFSLHVRYLSALALLLTLFTLTYLSQNRLKTDAEQTRADRDLAMEELLSSSLSEASDALKQAAGADAEIGEYGRALRKATRAIERIRGGSALYTELTSRRLSPYLSQMSDELDRLSERAGFGITDPSDRALCLRLAEQIDTLMAEDGSMLRPDAGAKLDLRISPYLKPGWRLR